MRTHYNRQARRAALCVGARGLERRRRASPVRRVWLTAYGRDLAQVATRIGERIQLPRDLVELLSPAGLPTCAGVDDR